LKKKIKEKTKSIKTRKPVAKRTIKKAKKPKQEEKLKVREAAFEAVIESSKYAPAENFQVIHMPFELPQTYGQDKITLLVRDPSWIFCYWELTPGALDKLRGKFSDFPEARFVLRVYDVTNVEFNGANSNGNFDITISSYATSWYINTEGADRSWCVDLGLLFPDGRFVTILRSNIVHTPRQEASHLRDEDWMIPEEMFNRLYAMGFGFGQSSPRGKGWQEKIKNIISSMPGSMGSPVKAPLQQKNFWLNLDCELIVYGATESDAKVTVGNQEIKLRPDGSFTLRFALPDGIISVPVKAVSADGKEERSITPIVERNTK